MKKPVPLAEWLDENVDGWRDYTPVALDVVLRRLWHEGRFRRLRGHTRNCGAEAVLVSASYFAYIEF